MKNEKNIKVTLISSRSRGFNQYSILVIKDIILLKYAGEGRRLTWSMMLAVSQRLVRIALEKNGLSSKWNCRVKPSKSSLSTQRTSDRQYSASRSGSLSPGKKRLGGESGQGKQEISIPTLDTFQFFCLSRSIYVFLRGVSTLWVFEILYRYVLTKKNCGVLHIPVIDASPRRFFQLSPLDRPPREKLAGKKKSIFQQYTATA